MLKNVPVSLTRSLTVYTVFVRPVFITKHIVINFTIFVYTYERTPVALISSLMKAFILSESTCRRVLFCSLHASRALNQFSSSPNAFTQVSWCGLGSQPSGQEASSQIKNLFQRPQWGLGEHETPNFFFTKVKQTETNKQANNNTKNDGGIWNIKETFCHKR